MVASLDAVRKGWQPVVGRLLGGDELDKVTGGGATRLRHLWGAFSKDLIPGNRHEPGLGGIGEPRAGTSLEGHPDGRRRQTPAHSSADASIRRPRARILSSRQVLVPIPANLSRV